MALIRGQSARRFGANCPVDFAVAPVIANHSGARRAGQGRDSGEHSERTLGVLGMHTEQ